MVYKLLNIISLEKPTVTQQNRLVEQQGFYLVMTVLIQFLISHCKNGIPHHTYFFRRNLQQPSLSPLELGRLIT